MVFRFSVESEYRAMANVTLELILDQRFIGRDWFPLRVSHETIW